MGFIGEPSGYPWHESSDQVVPRAGRLMTVITIDRFGANAEVRFAYDPDAVDVIRGTPFTALGQAGRLLAHPWHPRQTDHRDVTPGRFRRADRRRVGNDEHANPVDPVAAMLAVVPERLRVPTVRALAKVWHPDQGGDGALMRRLNDMAARRR